MISYGRGMPTCASEEKWILNQHLKNCICPTFGYFQQECHETLFLSTFLACRIRPVVALRLIAILLYIKS